MKWWGNNSSDNKYKTRSWALVLRFEKKKEKLQGKVSDRIKTLIISHLCIYKKKKAMLLLFHPIAGLFLLLHENMVHIFWVFAIKPQAVLWLALDFG